MLSQMAGLHSLRLRTFVQWNIAQPLISVLTPTPDPPPTSSPDKKTCSTAPSAVSSASVNAAPAPFFQGQTSQLPVTYLMLSNSTFNLVVNPLGSIYKIHFTSDYYSSPPSRPPWSSHSARPQLLPLLPSRLPQSVPHKAASVI